MISIDKRLFEYVVMYYEYNKDFQIPENLEVTIPKDYDEAIHQKAEELFGNSDSVPVYNTDGMFMRSNEGKYFVYIAAQDIITAENISVLFHELSHIHTLPEADILYMKNKDKSGTKCMKGYEYWKEFLAQYHGLQTFINTCGEVGEIDSKEKQLKTCTENISEKISDLENTICFLILSEHNIINDLKTVISESKVKVLEDLADETCRYIKEQNLPYAVYDKLGKIIEKLEK